MTLDVIQEKIGSDVRDTFTLSDLEEVMTVRDLIKSFVYQEVKDYNQRFTANPGLQGEIVPLTEYEKQLNAKSTGGGGKSRQGPLRNWKEELEVVLEAFSSNGIFVIVDEVQVEELEQQINISPTSDIRFVRLIPLIGG